MNLQSSTLKDHEPGRPFHVQQAGQIQVVRDARKEAGHERDARVPVSRSIFALTDKQDWMYFGARNQDEDQAGITDSGHRAISGRSYAAEPGKLTGQLKAEDSDGMHRVDLARATSRTG